MTGDGAVVRQDSVILAFTVADFLNSYRGFSPYGDQVRTALHDLEATIRQQAAEIERLTREYRDAVEHCGKLDSEIEASEARNADLLKALERQRPYLHHKIGCESFSTDECTCGLAAAKGETV